MKEQPPEFNFEEKNQEEAERKEVAMKYKVVNPEKLSKKDGKWFFGDMAIEEWDNLFNRDEGDKYWQR